MAATQTRTARIEIDPGEATLGAGVGLLIARFARACAWRLGRSLAEGGLRWADYAVLHHLAVQGPASQRELAAALRIQPSNIVALLDELQHRGLLHRSPDPADRRRHRVELTPRGNAALERATKAARAAEADLLAPLSAGERRQFRAYLVRLTAHACDRSGFGCAPRT
jgi:MarR family transcriptional regulator, lower aerobic nicotinate degradation pathway regulator